MDSAVLERPQTGTVYTDPLTPVTEKQFFEDLKVSEQQIMDNEITEMGAALEKIRARLGLL